MEESSILIIGVKGQVGLALQQKYPNARKTSRGDLDITNEDSVNNFDWNGVKVIINAAAYTNVDGAESDIGRIEAWKANAEAVANLVRIARDKDLTLVHLSSEYVFDGTKTLHLETEPLSPLGVYGQSKAAGDIAIKVLPKHYLIRTSWVVGEGKNFVRAMIMLGQKGIEPSVVADQIGRLSFTSEIVRAIDHILYMKAPYGTYNVSNDGDPVSWANVAREIYKLAGYNLSVTDTTTKEYFSDKKGSSLRPLNSTLSLDKIHSTGFISHNWNNDLKDYIDKELYK